MKSLRKFLLGASCLALPVLSNGQSFDLGKKAYDVDSMKFSDFIGGIDEKVLNKYENGKDSYYFRDIYNEYDRVERSKMFLPPTSGAWKVNNQGALMGLSMMYSKAKMDSLEGMSIEDIEGLDKSLKRFMLDFSSEDFDSLNNYNRCKKMYELIMSEVNVAENNEDAIPIELVLNGYPSVCRDLVPTFYSLFNRYGVETKVAYARMDSVSYHTWLRVNVDSTEFDLDPTWYGIFFLPLEKRFSTNVFSKPNEMVNYFLDNLERDLNACTKQEDDCENDSSEISK